jgi:large subunit ribosomal protein L30
MTTQQNTSQQVAVTLIRSLIGTKATQIKVVKALGLYKTNQTVKHYLSPTIQGMINKITHLVKVEAVS